MYHVLFRTTKRGCHLIKWWLDPSTSPRLSVIWCFSEFGVSAPINFLRDKLVQLHFLSLYIVIIQLWQKPENQSQTLKMALITALFLLKKLNLISWFTFCFLSFKAAFLTALIIRFFWEHFIWIDLHSVDRMIIMNDHLSLFSEISPRAHSANWEHNRVLRHSYLMNFFYYYSKELRKAPCNRFRKQNRLLTFCNTPCNFASQWIARINRAFYSETWLNLIEWVFKTERSIPTAHEQILKSERANQNVRNDLENMRFNNVLLGNSYFQNISSYLESMLVPEIRKN